MTVTQTPTDAPVLPAERLVAPILKGVRAPGRVRAPCVLGLYSSGGGGHISALDSIETALSDSFDVRRVAPLREILHRIDPVARLSAGRFDGELLFNHLAERGHARLLAGLEKIGTRRVHTQRTAMAALLRAAISEYPPALIVSTMPFINAAVSDVAAALGIPFVVVPTDYDMTNFVAGLQHPLPKGQHVVHAFAEQAEQFPGMHLGYPLRPQFTAAVNRERYTELRRERGIAPGTRVVVISVGSAGGVRALTLARQLARAGSDHPLHVVICCGRNARLLRRARGLRAKGISIDARGYTTDMPGLLGAADVLVTKPGGGTVMEALAMGVPFVIDHAKPCVPWERANLALATSRGAFVLGRADSARTVVDNALAAPRSFAAAAQFADFQTGFLTLVDALVAPKW